KTQTTYYQNIALAERQLSAGNVGRAEEFLNECPPELRGWEWRFLKRQRYGNAPPLEHPDAVFHVVFSPDGRQILSGGQDETIRIWDALTGALLYSLPKHWDEASYSSDGQHLALTGDNKTIRVFKATTGELLATVPGGFPVAFSPDGWTLATVGQDRSVG